MTISTVWKSKQTSALASSLKQVAAGKKSARERIAAILDEHSFEETDQLALSPFLEEKHFTDGVVCGFGTINGQRVALYAQDFSIKGGSVGKRHAEKICKIMDLAAKIGCPIIGMLDSGGARIDEGIHALAGYGEIFMRNVRYSGIIPQISLILGPCAGGAAYSPALGDFILTIDGQSNLFITGPQVIRQVLHQEISKEELGGARVHASKSGLVHLVASNEEECFATLKRLLSYLPDNYRSFATLSEESLHQPREAVDWERTVPRNSNQPYDTKQAIAALVDHESFFEIQELFAPNIVVGFAHLARHVIGIVANQTLSKAGTIDIDASCKAARFIKTCNNFNIPILSLVDVPGFLPGIDQEHNGIIRHGAKLLYAYAQATVPKITLILRKAYGGAYIVMGSKHLGADFVFAWPSAQIAVMGSAGAVSILHKKKLDASPTAAERSVLEGSLIKHYEAQHLNPFIAAESGYIDAIIEPAQTRAHLIRAFEITHNKVEHLPARKHGNIPL